MGESAAGCWKFLRDLKENRGHRLTLSAFLGTVLLLWSVWIILLCLGKSWTSPDLDLYMTFLLISVMSTFHRKFFPLLNSAALTSGLISGSLSIPRNKQPLCALLMFHINKLNICHRHDMVYPVTVITIGWGYLRAVELCLIHFRNLSH